MKMDIVFLAVAKIICFSISSDTT